MRYERRGAFVEKPDGRLLAEATCTLHAAAIVAELEALRIQSKGQSVVAEILHEEIAALTARAERAEVDANLSRQGMIDAMARTPLERAAPVMLEALQVAYDEMAYITATEGRPRPLPSERVMGEVRAAIAAAEGE